MRFQSLGIVAFSVAALTSSVLSAPTSIVEADKRIPETDVLLTLAGERSIEPRDNTAATTPVTNGAQYSFPAQLSQSAYCGLAVGAKIGDATILYKGGDGGATPMYYIAYSATKGIVVSHQGTNTSSLASISNDVNFKLTNVDSRLSYLGSGAQVSTGFQTAWLRTADTILSQVKTALTKYPGAKVFTTGHSLGASISLLDALYLKKQLPSNSVSSITFGLPRTGNQAFANAVDSNLAGFVHINNGRDPVPRLPGTGFDFIQVSGEIWINPANGNAAVNCPGQENFNCIRSVDPLLFNVDDHTGTYFRVRIAGRGANCPAVIA
ncbi:alpha/beta-hydrolase [Violaceomyces palustris]|uniref:Alpha/beta-hydrolase n=1 Tax=Violaceomyces palustris TaxID=1673888 RepID=A0ACD0NX37_9BASI|nr:alpha/beta-hydrolase [Violaceomyces palustris]